MNLLDLELQLINTKLAIKNKLKALLNELKKFKVQGVLALKYKKRNYHKIFHSSTKVTARYLDIAEAFKSMHQNIIIKIIVKHSIIFLSVGIRRINCMKK